MTNRAHNGPSEFAAAVRASALRRHGESFPANCYRTAFDAALATLGLRNFAWETIRNWRRGTCGPRPWAAKLVANQLRENAQAQIELADYVEKEIGPGSPGKAGAAALRRWRAQRSEMRNSESSS